LRKVRGRARWIWNHVDNQVVDVYSDQLTTTNLIQPLLRSSLTSLLLSYKVTDATRRYILAQNPTLLIYNKSKDFGLSSTGTGGSSGLAGTFYDVTFDGFDKDIRGGNNPTLEEFRKQVGGGY
jgi:hypothetical protein